MPYQGTTKQLEKINDLCIQLELAVRDLDLLYDLETKEVLKYITKTEHVEYFPVRTDINRFKLMIGYGSTLSTYEGISESEFYNGESLYPIVQNMGGKIAVIKQGLYGLGTRFRKIKYTEK